MNILEVGLLFNNHASLFSALGPTMEVSTLKLVLTLITITLLATFAGATTVDFNGYSPLDTCMSPISTGGLDFTAPAINCGASPYLFVWDGSSPNGNGTPALIYGYGAGTYVDITRTGGGTFNLSSVDMTISWYDGNASEVITVNGSPITLVQGLQTYNLNLSNVTSVAFSGMPSNGGYWLMDNVVYNTTPEPGTLALLGSGMLAGLGVVRRKMLL
jgi:PEP-CTERM motif